MPWKYVSQIAQLLPLTCGTETGLRPNILTDFHRRWMDVSTDMKKRLCVRATFAIYSFELDQ